MWPKLLTQLVELLPHVARLIPMADLFFQSKASSDRANQTALADLATGVRTDLNHVTAAHDGLYRQLQAQSAQIADAAADASRARVASESCLDRVAALERHTAALERWFRATALLLLLTLAGVVLLLLRIR